jgi:hypothetical protein
LRDSSGLAPDSLGALIGILAVQSDWSARVNLR